MTPPTTQPTFDLKNAISDNRLVGLWRMTAGLRLTYLGAIISLELATVARTATFLLLRYLVDTVLTGTAALPHQLPLVALGFVGLALVQGSLSFLSGRLASRTAEGIALRLRNYMFDHIQRLPFTYHDRTQTGELIQRSTSDVDAIRRFFADQAIGIGRIGLLFIVNFTALLSLNWRLALVSIVAVPFLAAISVFFFKRVSQAYEAYQEQEAALSTTLEENLTGVCVVKAFGRQDYERERFERDNREEFRRGQRLATMESLFWPASDLLCHAQMLAGYLIGALMAIRGVITPGDYMAYIGLLVWLIWPMRNLGHIIVEMSTGLVSYERVMEVIKKEREPLEDSLYRPAGAPEGRIVFDHVCFQYDDANIPALKEICFRCAPGQVIALVGSTGSGKTTLVNLLLRFYDYTEGSLTLDGVELKHYPRRYLRRQIGIVEQEPFLFSRTIRENITYGVGHEVSDAEIEAAARAAAIHDEIMAFPDGYNTLIGEKGVTLSGGQKQRIAIARTLLKNPRILILDDATSSVDTETDVKIRAALERLMRGRTTFIIAHRIQSVIGADLILVLNQGKIVQQGTHDELMAQEGIYRQIYDLQVRLEGELEKELAADRDAIEEEGIHV